MADRKSFLLRVDRETLDAVQRWANDDLRSLNGQIEFLLRRALLANGRVAEQHIAVAQPHISDSPPPRSVSETVDDVSDGA
jgi:hypothetical protein